MILNSLDKQFALDEQGQITWQKDLTNPMPGEVVAEIKKGEAILKPTCSVVEGETTEGQDKEAVENFIQEWLGRHVKESLEPLFNLQDENLPQGAPQDIAVKLYESLGVITRSEIQDLIAVMDEEQRASLRPKKIRFGPLLVYLPELNKPAAVRLRALLLTLWNEGELPATVPADGIVSFSVEGQELDKAYYQSIGYPIYGPRSIRVDMLDRVICAVYDSAKEGKFMAQHQMAEWLGSNIADLYAVLEAMGHKKIHDPADEVAATEVEKKDKPEAEESVEAQSEDANAKPEEIQEAKVKDGEKKEIVKPDLATFALKKGKVADKPAVYNNTKKNKLSGSQFSTDNKKFKKKKLHKKKPREQQRERVYTAEAESKPEDNPFAILQQLKTGGKE
jgi:ATP-dependent RNA helicase SUPV3L1/SUV3